MHASMIKLVSRHQVCETYIAMTKQSNQGNKSVGRVHKKQSERTALLCCQRRILVARSMGRDPTPFVLGLIATISKGRHVAWIYLHKLIETTNWT